MKKTFISALVVFFCVCVLIGCGKADEESDDKLISSYSNENIFANFRGQTDVDGDGFYYLEGSKIYYRDSEQNRKIILCMQQGCKHEDESCVAYQSDAIAFGCYQGMWYWLCNTNDEQICLIQEDWGTNKRKNILTLNSEKKNEIITSDEMFFSYGRIYISVTRQYDSTDLFNSDSYYLCVDLADCSVEKIEYDFEHDNRIVSEIQFLGASESTAWLMICLTEPVYQSFESFSQTCSDVENAEIEYSNYQLNHIKDYSSRNIYKYVFEDKKLVQVTDTGDCRVSDILQSANSDVCCFFTQTPEKQGADFWQINLHTEELGIIMEEERHYMHYGLHDGKMFFSVEDEHGEAYFYYYDFADGSVTQMDNQGNKEYMFFSIAYESKSQFFGMCNGGMKAIRKEDFYKEDYSKTNAF